MKQSRSLTEGALFTALYLILLFFTMYIPIIGSITMFLLAIPFTVYASRHGLKASLLMFSAALLLSLMYIISIPVTLLMGLGGIAVGVSIYLKKNAYETWARGTIGFVVGFVLVYIISQVLFDMSWTEQIKNMMDSVITSLREVGSDVNAGDAFNKQLTFMEDQINQLIYLIPSSIVISSITFAFICQWISYKVLNRVNQQNLHFPHFYELQFPTSIIWYYFFAILIMWMEPNMESIWNQAGMNVYILTGVLLLLQGISFMAYFSRTKGYNRTLSVIGIFVCSLILPSLVRILGIIDLGFGLRKRVKKS